MRLNKDQATILSDFCFELAKGFCLAAVVQQIVLTEHMIILRIMQLLTYLVATCICLVFSIKFKAEELYND